LRLLLATDLHASPEAIEIIAGFARKLRPDALLIAGDLTHFGPAAYVRSLLEAVDCTVYAVNGNCDTQPVVAAIQGSRADLMDRVAVIDEAVVAGVAWSGRRSLDRVDPGLAGKINKAGKGRPVIILSHSPALGTLDEPTEGVHLGSRELLELVTGVKPIAVVTGHVHEARGVVRSGAITYVNPGPAMYGLAAVLTIDGRGASVELL
jgi:Icc-related predicted phosphoesterase